MVKLSELATADAIHERDLADPEYRAEQKRSRLSTEVAIRVLRYRTERELTQTAFGHLVRMSQPQVARLEAGEHQPSLATLAKLSAALDVDFTLQINPTGVHLRASA